MAKEKSINPAQAHRKAEKAKALKKGKAEQAARRTEKLARRNPDRLQRQIDDLRATESSGRALNTREKALLEELERDVKAVRKARETLGDKAPQFLGSESTTRGGHADGSGRGSGTLGKRRREDDGGRRQYNHHHHHRHQDGESDSSTSSSVRNIPMPRDTPPPIPAEFLHLLNNNNDKSNPNLIPLPTIAPDGSRIPHPLPPKPEPVQTQTVYEAKPVVRDLRKEAVSAFVPSVVRRKLDASKGQGGKLLEPEEVERLEKEGYTGGGGAKRESDGKNTGEDEVGTDADRLEEEEKRFERELRGVEVEEVEDDGI